MNTSHQPTEDRSPAVVALVNAAYAIVVCTAIHILCGWGIDWGNGLVGKPPAHKAPTWTGTAIVAFQTGWPVLAISVASGLFGRNLSGLTPTLVATHFLGLIDPIAAIVVGGILVLLQRSNEE
jgi:hypothetical protein